MEHVPDKWKHCRLQPFYSRNAKRAKAEPFRSVVRSINTIQELGEISQWIFENRILDLEFEFLAVYKISHVDSRHANTQCPPPMRRRAALACTLVSFLLTRRLVAVHGPPTNSYESAWMHKMLLQRQQRYWLTLKRSPCPRKALIPWTTSSKPQPMLASVETRAKCPESLDTTPFIWLGDVIITHMLEHSTLGGGKATETWDWIIFGLSRERLSKSRPIWLTAR